MTIEDILSRLEGVTPCGADKWQSLCPAHDDKTPSLSIEIADNGKVLLYCHSGCEFEDIRTALDLEGTPLAVSTKGKPKQSKGRSYTRFADARKAILRQLKSKTGTEWHHVTTWHYQDETKESIGEVHRFEDGKGNKEYRPLFQDSNGWKISDPPGGFPLYRLPDILKAEQGNTIYICEGEKCVDSLRELGYVATTSSHGAKSAGNTPWSPLAGRSVVILPDRDEAGEAYVRAVAHCLHRLDPPATVKRLGLPVPDGGDVFDWIEEETKTKLLSPEEIRKEFDELASNAVFMEPDIDEIEERHGAPFVETTSKSLSVNQVYHAARWSTDTESRYDPIHGCFVRYDSQVGIWRDVEKRECIAELGEQYLRLCADNKCPAMLSRRTHHFLEQLYRLAISYAELYRAEAIPAGLIPVSNGVVDIVAKNPILKPHNPDYGFRNVSPVSWVENADCPMFQKALADALPDEDVSLIQRYAGQCLLGKNMSQKIMVLRGTSGGGKSTLVNIIEGVIGKHNTAQLRTQHLAERFETARLVGKTLLLGVDVPGNFLDRAGAQVLKSLVGGDPLDVERKGSNEVPQIIGTFNAVITANSRLRVRLDGDAGAWRRRLVIVDYERPPAAKPIPEFAAYILEKEGSGVLAWAVQGAIALLAELNHGGLSMKRNQIVRVEDLLSESDSVLAFVRGRVKTTASRTRSITTWEATEAYQDYCEEKDWTPIAERTFQARLAGAMRDVHGVQRRNDIRRGANAHRGYKGVTLVQSGTNVQPTENRPSEASGTAQDNKTSDASDDVTPTPFKIVEAVTTEEADMMMDAIP